MTRILALSALALVSIAAHAQLGPTAQQCQSGPCVGYGAPTGAVPLGAAYVYTDISQTPPKQYVPKGGAWTLAGGSGSGSGAVNTGTQYAIPEYTAAGTTVGPSNVVTDSTGNNLYVPSATFLGPSDGSAAVVLKDGSGRELLYVGGNALNWANAFSASNFGTSVNVGNYSGPVAGVSFTAGTGAQFKVSTAGVTTTPQIRSGVSANADIAGQLTLTAGTASFTFTGTYTSAPVCVASDTTAVAAVRAVATSTTLTLTGTSGDVANYICIGRN